MKPPAIHRVTTLDLKLESWSWPFASERRADIDAHFAEKMAEKPALWNGRVLLGRDASFEGQCLSARFFQTDFASFLAWRDWGFPDSTVFNGFGMGALRSSDGAFALGEMAAHTANAGRVYFPSGTPDPNDIKDGAVDIPGSVAREVTEETGLTEDDYRTSPHWHCVISGAAIAMIALLQTELPAEHLRARIEAELARQQEAELSRIHLVRTQADFTPQMPRFVTAFIEQQWA